MENEEKMMTGEESLKIITDMINKTKMNVKQGSFHLLFWGWLVMFCSLSQYLLTHVTSFETPWSVWGLVIPGIFVSIIYGMITGKKEHVHTYAERIFMWTWIAFLVVAVLMYIFINPYYELFPVMILMLAGFPTFISGVILRFRPLLFGGISFWVFSVVTFLAGQAIAPLIVSLAMLTGYLIPGYMLKRKDNHGNI